MGCKPAPVCKKALTDATQRWPKRNRASDGICGDAAHQKRPSDHNSGNAYDLTHDIDNGPNCHVLSTQVVNDPRVTYVIWTGKIYKCREPEKGWQVYRGPNPHNHHMHVSIKSESRDNLSPWPWTPKTERAAVERAIAAAFTEPQTPSVEVSPEDAAKGVTTSDKPASETAGTPPPAPAAEVKASEVSVWTRLTSLSIPAGALAVVTAIFNFVKNLPPYAWVALALIVVVAMVIGYLVWRVRDQQAHERTKIVLNAAADPEKNNLRLV